jgi:GNAT superfamily N-acetyltransferase
VTEVRLASPRDRDDAVGILAGALRHEPMVTWPLPPGAGHATLAAEFQILVDLYLPLGVLWIAGPGCAGVAAWLPPGEAGRFTELEAPTRDHIRPLTDDDGARYDAFWDWLGSHVPSEPCYFLDMVAVRSELRGRGIGRGLIEHGLRRAAANHLPAFLETGNGENVPLYEHLGFAVVAEERAPGDGPTVWFMRAEPTVS